MGININYCDIFSESGQVLTKMYSGDFFGEIGILNIEGASNKRTADVRSVGYAELFSLSKEDVLTAVKDYPEAEVISYLILVYFISKDLLF